jgi:hypothetical protein
LNYEVSDRSRSELYRDFLPLLNSRGVDLLDNDRLVLELIGLERRTSRGGADKIDHGPGGHDDVANAVAMACCNVSKTDKANRPAIEHFGASGYSIYDGSHSGSQQRKT